MCLVKIEIPESFIENEEENIEEDNTLFFQNTWESEEENIKDSES